MYVSQSSKYEVERYSPDEDVDEGLYAYISWPYCVAVLLQKRREENAVVRDEYLEELKVRQMAPPYPAWQFMNVELSIMKPRSELGERQSAPPSPDAVQERKREWVRIKSN